MDMNMSMDMGIGTDKNHAIARVYWYMAAGIVGFLVVVRGINFLEARQRLQRCRDASIEHPTRPAGPLSQAWATAVAIAREVGHPQAFVPMRGLQWATPPPLGRVLFLLAYWAVIAFFMSWDAIKMDVNFLQRIGFRNAWVTLTQLPMLYLLSMKANPVGFLVGISHERINWLHRWVARTMFITATVHGFHFWTMYREAGLLSMAMEVIPLSKYGFGMWGILLWNIITGFIPIRRLAYEVWVVQHVLASIAMLWLVYKHIPAVGRYNLWMAISFLVFDRAARWIILLWQNVRVKPNTSTCQGMRRIGHSISARAVGPNTTVLTVKDVHFTWTAGQHVYLWVPRLGLVEAHPYTIACAHQIKGTCCCGSIQLIVRAHKGFSKRIHTYASKNPDATLTGFLSGPYGAPPRWDIYETMVLVGASTGASFVIPILESVASVDRYLCVKRIEVALLARTSKEIRYYVQRAQEAAQAARAKGIAVTLHIAITGDGKGGEAGITLAPAAIPDAPLSDSDSIYSIEKSDINRPYEKEQDVDASGDHDDALDSCSSGSVWTPEFVREYTSRPDIEALIREPVEAAWGETAIVVCGGPEVVARTRNCVSQLSDERAVHKGTGAQGIYLHVEEYAF